MQARKHSPPATQSVVPVPKHQHHFAVARNADSQPTPDLCIIMYFLISPLCSSAAGQSSRNPTQAGAVEPTSAGCHNEFWKSQGLASGPWGLWLFHFYNFVQSYSNKPAGTLPFLSALSWAGLGAHPRPGEGRAGDRKSVV